MTMMIASGYVLSTDTAVTLLAAGLIFLLSLVLGVWKYRQMVTGPNHLAHPYVDTAHRAALLYSFATLLTAVFVELECVAQLGKPHHRNDAGLLLCRGDRQLHRPRSAS